MRLWIIQTLKRAAWAPLAVFVFFIATANVSDLYLRYPNLDMPTHFCGGLAMCYFYLVALNLAQPKLGKIPTVVQLLFSVTLTAFTAILWEFLEFLSDLTLGSKLNLGVTDILSDLFFGLLGAMVLAIAMNLYGIKKFFKQD